MKKTQYAALYCESGDCDGKPRCLGVFDTYKEAHQIVMEDMKDYSVNEEVNYATMEANHCVWSIVTTDSNTME